MTTILYYTPPCSGMKTDRSTHTCTYARTKVRLLEEELRGVPKVLHFLRQGMADRLSVVVVVHADGTGRGSEDEPMVMMLGNAADSPTHPSAGTRPHTTAFHIAGIHPHTQ